MGTPPAWQYFTFAYDEHWHHRGQLYTYLRLLGKEPPMLYDYGAGEASRRRIHFHLGRVTHRVALRGVWLLQRRATRHGTRVRSTSAAVRPSPLVSIVELFV